MKSIVLMGGRFYLYILLALVLPLNSISAGVLHFKMTAPKTTLTVGEEITVTVSAWVDDAVLGNGLDTWQLDLSVNNTGVIEITKTGSVADITLIAPNPSPLSGWSAASVNSPVTGEVRSVGITQSPVGAASDVGVGGYTDIFSFNIKALAVGMASYEICDDGGGLFYGCLVDWSEYDNTVPEAGSVIFDSEISNKTFTVIPVPEPASMIMFVLAGSLAFIRKK